MKINIARLPIKAHYFFFMAAMGPILPQLPVYGKQLGISPIVMGTVTGVLPIMFLIAKPIFGFIVDRFRPYRKIIFMTLVVLMGLFYALIHFINGKEINHYNMTCPEVSMCEIEERLNCEQLECECVNLNKSLSNITYIAYLSSVDQNKICFDGNITQICRTENDCSKIICRTIPDLSVECTVQTPYFWFFVIVMSAGTIGFNVVNSISDAICFDVLGDSAQMAYGNQRVWGTIGFGISALLSGFVVDWWSIGPIKNFTPALIIMLLFLSFDVLCCHKLELPTMETPDNILKDVAKLLKHLHIKIFMIFAAFAGIVDSFIVYFFFWYLEDLGATTGDTDNMKLLEGIIVAAETLAGEVVFFSISGVILERIGYGHALSMCFVNYALRLGLISVIPSPWWAIGVELFLQGPTYALCYTTIVAYASAISPPGTSATMQGIVAGIDDGFGYAIGSVLGGVLYRVVGGRAALQVFSGLALMCGIVHFILYKTVLENMIPKTGDRNNSYQSPEDAIDTLDEKSESI